MLKIRDASGAVVGTLKDEDSAPRMQEQPKNKSKLKRLVIQKEGEEKEDGDTNDVNV